jgi:hypothetical protein
MISRLGVVASVGFAVVIGAVLVFATRVGPVVRSAGQLTLAGLLLSTVGGFGSLFNLLVSSDIRAYNRICPFIAFFALMAIAAAIDGALTRGRRSGFLLAGIVLIVGVWDQAQALRPLAASRAKIEAEFQAVQQFVLAFEKAVPNGAMVLQLPFTIYLNDSGHARMRPYDHFKPYIVSRDLRWSYPALSNRQFAWQEAASQLEPADLASLAAETGFAFILMDRYGYADGAAAVLTALKADPGTKFLLEGDRYVAIDITNVAKTLTTVAGQSLGDFLADSPITAELAACEGAPTFSLDRIGGVVSPPMAGPIDVIRSRDLSVAGWAVTPEEHTPGSDLELALDGVAFAAAYGFDRPDVAAYLKAPESQPSGFRALIPSASLTPGSHRLSLRVQSRTRACFYESQAIPIIVH